MTATNFCFQCGSAISPSDRFCPNCGQPARQVSALAPASPQHGVDATGRTPESPLRLEYPQYGADSQTENYGDDPAQRASQSLFLGVGSLVLMLISGLINAANQGRMPPLCFILSLAALVMAIVGLVKGRKSRRQLSASGLPTGTATAGIVCSVINLVVNAISFLVGIVIGVQMATGR